MFSAIPQARSRPHLPCKFHRAFQIKLQEKMRGQNYCLLASPVTRRRWGLRLYNAYSCQGKDASNSIRSFVALLQASLLKSSPEEPSQGQPPAREPPSERQVEEE